MLRSEMMERMSASEFYDWMVLERMEPFGDRRADIQAGIVASTIANIHRSEKSKPYSPIDFMPRFEEPQQARQTPEQHLKMMLLFQKVQNTQVAHG